VEIEAKYRVPDGEVFAALLELLSLGSYALRPEGERNVVDHYLDTPRRDLLGAGYTCRLREGEADDHWLLTVKGLGRAEGAVHSREELESKVRPNTPPDEWPAGPAREIVTRLIQGQPLAELFTIRQHRADRAVEQDGRAVGTLSLDTVETDIGGRTKVWREIEIELVPTGTVEDLRAIGDALAPYKLKVQSKSKFERALARLDDAPRKAAAKKKKAPGVRADEGLVEAGRKILRFHCERMLANEEGTREGSDIEALHRMRVATRRQRAAFRVVAPHFRRKAVRGFQDELRTAAGRLGAVRDLDVLIEAAEAYRSSLDAEDQAALDPLLEEWRERRSAARDDLLAYLGGHDYAEFKERYAEFLSSAGAGVKDAAPDDLPEPHLVREVLPAEIWSHYARVRAYESVLGWASVETLHTLRIEAKRLRYLLESFGEVLGPAVAVAVKDVVRLQDYAGELHDADVTIGLLRHFLMHSPHASADGAVAAAVKGCLKVNEARLRTLQRGIKRPWRRVAGPRFRGTLARAVAAL
jgi:CHAD domain-containing protein